MHIYAQHSHPFLVGTNTLNANMHSCTFCACEYRTSLIIYIRYYYTAHKKKIANTFCKRIFLQRISFCGSIQHFGSFCSHRDSNPGLGFVHDSSQALATDVPGKYLCDYTEREDGQPRMHHYMYSVSRCHAIYWTFTYLRCVHYGAHQGRWPAGADQQCVSGASRYRDSQRAAARVGWEVTPAMRSKLDECVMLISQQDDQPTMFWCWSMGWWWGRFGRTSAPKWAALPRVLRVAW